MSKTNSGAPEAPVSKDIFAVDEIPPISGLATIAWHRQGGIFAVLVRFALPALLACLGLPQPAWPAAAQAAANGAPSVEAWPQVAALASFGTWGRSLLGTVRDSLAPVYVNVSAYLHPGADARLVWGSTARLEGIGPLAARAWQDPAATFDNRDAGAATISLRRPVLSQDNAGAGFWLNPAHFHIPWLLAPESTLHAMTMLSPAMIGPVHLNLIGARIGGRAGTSALYGQLVYRF